MHNNCLMQYSGVWGRGSTPISSKFNIKIELYKKKINYTYGNPHPQMNSAYATELVFEYAHFLNTYMLMDNFRKHPLSIRMHTRAFHVAYLKSVSKFTLDG